MDGLNGYTCNCNKTKHTGTNCEIPIHAKQETTKGPKTTPESTKNKPDTTAQPKSSPSTKSPTAPTSNPTKPDSPTPKSSDTESASPDDTDVDNSNDAIVIPLKGKNVTKLPVEHQEPPVSECNIKRKSE